MKDRLIKFLKSQNISYSKFADEIKVQRSSISHIISGRNNPSLELIQKILSKYENINSDWLILGKGDMYKINNEISLFDNLYSSPNLKTDNINLENEKIKMTAPLNNEVNVETQRHSVKKIILIYNDNTFEELNNSK